MAYILKLSNDRTLRSNEPVAVDGERLNWARLIEAGRFGGIPKARSYAEVYERPTAPTRSDKGVTAERVLALS